MAKNAELVSRLDKPIKREAGYFYFAYSNTKGVIDGIYRSKMQHGKKKVQ